MDEAKTYEPVGHCIYCDTAPGAADRLSREHIIPEALGGRLILPEASCGVCRDATSKVELFVLREMLGPTRAVEGIRSSRRKSTLPPEFMVGILKGDGRADSDIATEFRTVQLVPSLPVVVFGAPGFLRNETPTGDAVVHALGVMVSPVPRDPSLIGVRAETKVKLNHTLFFRMLAKIAHSYAIAELGAHAFRPFLTDIIRFGRGTAEAHYVGGFGGEVQPSFAKSESLHELQIDTIDHAGQDVVRVLIRLFAKRDFPVHQVIVGELIEKTP